MAYDKFVTLKSTAVPLSIENVDTDQIIPARFLKATERKGFGDNLFRDWRYNPDNTPKAQFSSTIQFTVVRFLLEGKILGQDLLESMRLGRCTTTVSVVLSPAFLRIFLEITVSMLECFLFRLAQNFCSKSLRP